MEIDRRESYYERVAAHIAKDPLGFYTRAQRGRDIQKAIKPKDFDFQRLVEKVAREALIVTDVNLAKEGHAPIMGKLVQFRGRS